MPVPTVWVSRTAKGANIEALAAQVRLVNAKVRLFQSGFVPNPQSPAADYIASECDFDGYAPVVLAAWLGPVLGPTSGWMIVAPLALFIWATTGANVGNQVGGWWIESAGGDVIDYGRYQNPLPMVGEGNVTAISAVEVFPAAESTG
jgi:hypothetical protein